MEYYKLKDINDLKLFIKELINSGKIKNKEQPLRQNKTANSKINDSSLGMILKTTK